MDNTNSISNAFQTIECATISESIKDLIRDIKATQSGDRTNPVFHLLRDHLKEKRRFDLLADRLLEMNPLAVSHANDLYLASLFFDLGKLLKPDIHISAKRLIESVLNKYGIKLTVLALRVIQKVENAADR